MPRKHPITTGDRFGRLTALETIKPINYPSQTGTARECRCDCGTVKFFATGALTSGNTKSCGCLNSEVRAVKSVTHGYAKGSTNRTRIYRIWRGMLDRCNNKNIPIYRHYGARGIAVCERWHTFENFLTDMGEPAPDQSIDRLNNNGNYEPGNCAWATKKQQARNRRSNVLWTYNGQTKTHAEWCEIIGISPSTLVARIWKGWSSEEIVKTPKLRGSQKCPKIS